MVRALLAPLTRPRVHRPPPGGIMLAREGGNDAPLERRGVRSDPPLDGSETPLRRAGRSRRRSARLPPRLRRLVALVQPGAPPALTGVPRLRARPARPRGLRQARMLLHG